MKTTPRVDGHKKNVKPALTAVRVDILRRLPIDYGVLVERIDAPGTPIWSIVQSLHDEGALTIEWPTVPWGRIRLEPACAPRTTPRNKGGRPAGYQGSKLARGGGIE